MRISYSDKNQKQLLKSINSKYKLEIVKFDPKKSHLDDLVLFSSQQEYNKYKGLYDLSLKAIILGDQQLIEDRIIRFYNQADYDKFEPILIPKILHFVWLSKEGNPPIPDKYRFNIDLFKKHNPDFKIIEWDNKKFEKVLNKSFPKYIEQFNKIPVHIIKCDIARMMILARYGGIYFDLDFYCRRSLNQLIQGKKIILTKEIPEHCRKINYLYNGVLGCLPNDNFVIGWIDKMFDNLSKISNIKTSHVMSATGPAGFWRYYQSLDQNVRPKLLSPKYLVPFSHNHTATNLLTDSNDVYTYTVWDEGTGWEYQNNDDWSAWIACLIVLILLVIVIYLVTRRK